MLALLLRVYIVREKAGNRYRNVTDVTERISSLFLHISPSCRTGNGRSKHFLRFGLDIQF